MPTVSQEELKEAIEPVYRLYAGLACAMDPDVGLGGKLLYAGGLDEEGCRLVRAANIAGAASLSASADAARQRQAMRERVIDFLVTSLDEALRILKNEIRKRNAVSVGVALAPAQVTAEMQERGVLPDLLGAAAPMEKVAFFGEFPVSVVAPAPLPDGCEFRIFPNPPADFDARALALVPQSDYVLRRWLRLSPRYLGPQARRVRSLPCDGATADKLTADS